MDGPDVRVSDAQRQAVVGRLSKATGDGMLTLDEFAEHAGRAYAAVTRADLDAVTEDLRLPASVMAGADAPVPMAEQVPAAAQAPAQAPAPAAAPAKRRWVVAIMGGESRKGRWRAGRRIGAFACMGGVDLDLRDALLEGDEIEITAWAIMGRVGVVVPDGIPVESSGFVLMGGRSNRVKDVSAVPGAPVVRVKGYGMWGGVDVRSRPSRRHQLASPSEPAAPAGVQHGGAEAPAGLLTIVCTDLVGSTRLADTLGDQRWRAIIQDHNAIVRERLARHGGAELKTRGDGFLCTFTSARRAVAFAVDVQDGIAAYRAAHPATPLEVRVGVHAGEVEHDGDDLVGRNVALACRLCDAAAPNEVLASAIVADLADSASDLRFGDTRQLALAGIERPVPARPAERR